MISGADLEFRGYLRAPHEAKPTALGLWTKSTDVFGRRECVPELIAGEIYPGQDATDRVETHLLMLQESGFLTLYRADGSEWIQLVRPLKADTRGAPDDCPPPPVQDSPWDPMAMGGARERAAARAGERMRAEQGVRASQWATWADGQERRPEPPRRPLLLDAPPIGCPDHPNGRYQDCGPCGTARRRHDRWVAEARYGEKLTDYEQAVGDDEPF
ncbi:hypothetical protein QWJ90_01425 [Microbacterium oryzae]|uniref:hypothetical protein n=1 Tax=Microbacterium oryzae TaxID=743009 RepID=UPI0025B13C50|nr:hypothetical protein [Microbacterium oryzae]MDN3309583.1 hypothetical protein [Microbacterium oryzae]